MKLHKITGIVAGITGILLGIVLLVNAVMDIDVPKPVRAVFAVVCLTNAVINIVNYQKKAKR